MVEKREERLHPRCAEQARALRRRCRTARTPAATILRQMPMRHPQRDPDLGALPRLEASRRLPPSRECVLEPRLGRHLRHGRDQHALGAERRLPLRVSGARRGEPPRPRARAADELCPDDADASRQSRASALRIAFRGASSRATCTSRSGRSGSGFAKRTLSSSRARPRCSSSSGFASLHRAPGSSTAHPTTFARSASTRSSSRPRREPSRSSISSVRPHAEIADSLAAYGPVEVHPPGIDKAALDRTTQSPYRDGPSAVFAGVSPLFDYETLAAAAELAPHVSFHVIGPPPRPLPGTSSFHPELPFDELVPYLQHATFGLLLFPPGYASLGQGNKIAQYSYCRLPIVAPSLPRGRSPERLRLSDRRPGEPRAGAGGGGAHAALSRLRRGNHVCRGAGCPSRGCASGRRKRVNRDQRPPVQLVHARADDAPEGERQDEELDDPLVEHPRPPPLRQAVGDDAGSRGTRSSGSARRARRSRRQRGRRTRAPRTQGRRRLHRTW